MSIIFDTDTGKRIYRTITGRTWARLSLKALALWAVEIAGVGLIALAGAIVHPSIGLVVVGVYFVFAAFGASE